MRKVRLLLAAAAIAAALAVPANAASLGAATVRASILNLRSGPATTQSVITTAADGAAVVVGEKASEAWYKVVYHGFTGYMNAGYLDFSEKLEGNFGSGDIRGTTASLRTEPDLLAPSLGLCTEGTTVRILGVSGAWYKVQYGSFTGYIYSDSIALTPLTNCSTPAADAVLTPEKEETEVGQQIVKTAMKYLGCPYVYGGSSPSGFDCSGFVQYVYNECGYTVNRTAASIYSGNGTAVSKEDLAPGDVVCFSTSAGAVGHVGIYIGDGQFIHASNSRTGVIITPLDMDYWASSYIGARRIV